jgi:hypothetical protein
MVRDVRNQSNRSTWRAVTRSLPNPVDIILEYALIEFGVVKSMVTRKQPPVVHTLWMQFMGKSIASPEYTVKVSPPSRWGPIISRAASFPAVLRRRFIFGILFGKVVKILLPSLPMIRDSPSAVSIFVNGNYKRS